MAQTAALDAAIAATRLGMGARPGEIARIGGDARGWALAQVTPNGADQPQGFGSAGALLGTPNRLAEYGRYLDLRRAAARDGAGPDAEEAYRAIQRGIRDETMREFAARARLGAVTNRGFAERWALFWANWFTVTANTAPMVGLPGAFEREVIRPNSFGRFVELLVAVERHPAMLMYLDQDRSIGPNSPQGRQATGRGRGLNENLAREIMELHTVGADGGYSQSDVTEFARALTGWGTLNGDQAEALDEQGAGARTGFTFRPNIHEPGERRIMGRAYADDGLQQATRVMRDLAAHPATAWRVASKLAGHFVSDTPPPNLITRLEQAFQRSSGDLSVVARALIEAPETWAPEPAKVKSPYDFLVSAYRAAGRQPGRTGQINSLAGGLGQTPFRAPSPEGWPDDAGSWASPDGMVRRLGFAQSLAAEAAPSGDVAARAADVLGARLGMRSATAIRRSESREEAFALLLMSPEFQRR